MFVIHIQHSQEDRARLAAEVRRLQAVVEQQAAELQAFADSDPEVRGRGGHASLTGCVHTRIRLESLLVAFSMPSQ